GVEGPGGAEAPEDETARYLKSLSLEDLAGLEVTSVSRKTEKLSDVAAAVFVITNEDIRRSGVTSIPEALRMAPGVEVARINANVWAITARGFNSYFANHLLVMIDGRTVYSPLSSGVFWNVQDVLMEDIERIEVIRGPGASLWGANAVNGIINIITKSSTETCGGLVAAGAGTEERGSGAVRYGGRFGENAHLRVYAKYFDRDAGADAPGFEANDDWRMFRGGFRADWTLSGHDNLTLQGDVYGGSAGVTYTLPMLTPPYTNIVREDAELEGGNLLARWKHAFSEAGDMALQVYYDRTENADSFKNETRDTVDVDVQHGFSIGDRHDLLWGFGHRWTRDYLGDVPTSRYRPRGRTLKRFSLFIQDQVALVDDALWLIVGSKFENNDYTGWEVQPTGRLLWKPRESHTFWAAVSRAVRTPSISEREGWLQLSVFPPGAPGNPGPLSIMMLKRPNDDFASEELIASEAGFRFTSSERFICDISLFYNVYDDLNAFQNHPPLPAPDPDNPHMVMPVEFINAGKARTRGVELAAVVSPVDWNRIRIAYTHLHVDEVVDVGNVKGRSPEHRFSLRSSMDLSHDLELDLWARYVGELSDLDVEDYVTLDVRLAWRPNENLEVSLVGQNLLEDEHMEFQQPFSPIASTAVERGVYGKVTWRF
ncbi:MAG: TonB-dependent receptor, partial [Desulfobacterales bacterium]|nr:TonB-dependent receptor [Desulfobacterales bacterium]